MTPPSPSTGSSRIEPDVVARRGAQRRRRRSAARSARPASSGSNAARFAGWPVTESAPVVRPWKLCSSAMTPGLAGRLARVLQRRLVRLGARVAEERLRAAEALATALARAARAGSVP